MKEENKKYNIAIVGRPNVGKSSLFNRIVGSRRAIVLDEPRTTRDPLEEVVEIGDKRVNLIDTAGHFKGVGSEIENKSMQKIHEVIGGAEKIILVVDGEVAPSEEDKIIADRLRKTGKKIVLAINKIDNPKKKNFAEEYKKMGFAPIFKISTIHNLGIEELVSEVIKEAPKEKPELKKSISGKNRETLKKTKVTIIGRPNVGKSSIMNALCKEQKAIVTNEPGTTRDTIKKDFLFNNIQMELSDTVGARRPGKIGKAYMKGQPIERFAHIRTKNAIFESDIILLVIDASEKRATTQELHIAGTAKEAGKGIILIVNKWDLAEETTQEEFLTQLRNRFGFMSWVPVVFVSAKTGLNIDEIGNLIKVVSENQNRRISTSKLNRLVEEFVSENIPKGKKRARPKIFFAAQIGVVPPTFEIRAKNHRSIHFSWRRALINHLRKNIDFSGTPIRIVFENKKS